MVVISPCRCLKCQKNKSYDNPSTPLKKTSSVVVVKECEITTKKTVRRNVVCGGDDAIVNEDLSKIMEFMAFMAEMKTKFPEHQSTYQLSSCSQGLEFKFRLARCAGEVEGSNFTSTFSRPEDLTDAEKKTAAKKEKNRRKKREARKRKRNSQKVKNCEERIDDGLFEEKE